MPAKPSGEASQPVKQEGELQVSLLSSLFPPNPTLSLIPSHVADLLWPQLTCYPYSQGTKQILMEQPAFLPPVDLLSLPTSSPSSFLSVSPQYLAHFTKNPYDHI